MGLLRKLFWFGLFVAFTFCFVVLFEYGAKDYFKNFPKNAETEFARLQAYTEPASPRSTDGDVK